MNEIIWYVPAAYIWCYIGSKVPLGIESARANEGRYDNRSPREQQNELTGKGARLRAAHYNAIEAFPPFATAVIVASLAQEATTLMHACAAGWILCRLVYQVAYAADLATLRTTVWGGSVAATLGLFVSWVL